MNGRRALALGTCVMLLAPAIVTRADDDDARTEARREFAAAQAAEQAHDYQTAIEHYLRANQLVPHAFNLFNVGANFEKLGKLRDAAAFYQRYLDMLPDAPDRAKVVRLIADLKTRGATLAVHTTPPGAQLQIDGAPAGITPFIHLLPGGRHTVAVERDGLREERELTIEYAEPVSLDITISPGAASLLVSGSPLGAQILIDGQLSGLVPTRISVAPGQHHVEVTSYGYTPFDTTVTVTRGSVSPIQAYLTRGDDTGTTSGVPAIGVGPGGQPKRPIIPTVTYMVGAGGGTFLNGQAGAYFAELGAFLNGYGLLSRVGRAGSETTVSVLFRWATRTGRWSPFFGLGYMYVTGLSDEVDTGSGSGSSAEPAAESGLDFEAGIRYTLVESAKLDVNLAVGLHLYLYKTGTDADAEDASFPLLVSLELQTR